MLASLAVFIIGFTMEAELPDHCPSAQDPWDVANAYALNRLGNFYRYSPGSACISTLLVSAIMMALDLLIGTSFFMPAIISAGAQTEYSGGSPVYFSICFGSSVIEVYIVALPAFGLVSDIISVHARKAIFGYRMMVWAIVAIGALSFIVWAHHMYVSGMNPYFGFFFATTTLIIAVPTAIKVYNWVLTLWRGNIKTTVPMLFAIGFVFTFINGGLTGLFLGNVTIDLPLSDTYFVVAHFHMVMAVSPVLVVFGSIYHWYPKITGRMYNDTMARIHFWCTFIGSYAIYYPMHYLGIQGMPRRYFSYGETEFISSNSGDLNAAISVAAIFVAVSQIFFFWNIIASLFKGEKADPNPWEARLWNGRRPRHHQGMEILTIFLWFIGGLTTLACLDMNRISFLRMYRRQAEKMAKVDRISYGICSSYSCCLDGYRCLVDYAPINVKPWVPAASTEAVDSSGVQSNLIQGAHCGLLRSLWVDC